MTYMWSIGNTRYELFPNHNHQMVRVTAENPYFDDLEPREFYFPKRLLQRYAADAISDRVKLLFEDD